MSESVSGIRHAVRGCFNALKLCASALELNCTHEEQVEFIEDVIRASDKMGGLLTQLEQAIESADASSPAPASTVIQPSEH